MTPRDLRTPLLALAILIATAACARVASDASRPFDLVIANGHVIDGTGSPWYAADIGIRSGRIAAIGNLSSAAAARRVDAHGMVVAPGFIDMLGLFLLLLANLFLGKLDQSTRQPVQMALLR